MADPLLDKTELRDCIFWLAKLQEHTQDLVPNAKPLTKELTRLLRTCINCLVEINNSDSPLQRLSFDVQENVCDVLEELGTSMQNLHRAVSHRESLNKNDTVLLSMQHLQLADDIAGFDQDLNKWLTEARDDNHKHLEYTTSELHGHLYGIKTRTDTALEVANLISATPDTKDEPQTHS